LMLPTNGPQFLPASMDWRVLLVSVAVSLAAAVLFAVVPALETSNIDLAGAMRADGGGVVGSGRRAWFRAALIVTQVALSFALPPNELPTIDYNEVGPDYLATMGIPLVTGREFTPGDNDTAPLVAIVNQAMGNQLWPGQDVLGRRIQVKGKWLRIVGFARN